MDATNTNVIDPGPAPEAAPPPRRIPVRRSTTDRVVGGVSGGIGRRFGVDPVVLRVAFVVGILLAGFGPLLYLALWLLLPPDTDRTDEVLTREPLQLITGLVLAVIAFGSAVHWVTTLGELTGLIVAGSLVALGIWLYTKRDHRPPLPRTAEPPAPPVGYAYGGTGTDAPPTGLGGIPDLCEPVAAPVAPMPPRERSYLGLITLFVTLLVAGVLGLAQALGWLELSAVSVLAILLGILAAGLLVGAFAGRARWLAAPALLLAMVMAVTAPLANALPGALAHGVGERSWYPSEAGGTYELSLGRATLDLTEWAGQARPQPTGTDTITAAVTAGELDVTVPDNWDVTIDARVGAGDIVVLGDRVDQPALEARYNDVIPATAEAVGTLRLVLDVQYGSVRIAQSDPVPAGNAPVPTPTTEPEPTRTGPSNDQRRDAAR